MRDLDALLASAESTSVSQFGPYGNVFLRPMRFPEAGSLVVGHKHNYSHITIVMRGSVLARAWDTDEDGKDVAVAERVFSAPAFMQIRADRWHEFIALENNTYAVCVFALRDRDGNVTEVGDNDFDMSCSE